MTGLRRKTVLAITVLLFTVSASAATLTQAQEIDQIYVMVLALQAQNTTLSTTVGLLSTQMSQLSNQVTGIKSQVTGLNVQVANLSNQLSTSNVNLDVEVENLSALVKALQASVDQLQPPPAKTNTRLLFPFVNTAPGFDSGISIANTGATNGLCTLKFYGFGAPADYTTPAILSGTNYAFQVSNLPMGVAGFTGYVIATCNFPGAKGFELFSDTGIRNWATDVAVEELP
jgi:hypothetical protein